MKVYKQLELSLDYTKHAHHTCTSIEYTSLDGRTEHRDYSNINIHFPSKAEGKFRVRGLVYYAHISIWSPLTVSMTFIVSSS